MSMLYTNALKQVLAKSKQMDITVHRALAMLAYLSMPRPGMQRPSCCCVHSMVSNGTTPIK